jgi:hypothetical protein
MTELERRTLEHESGHAAAALCLRLPVDEVSRSSSDPRVLGWVTLPGVFEDLDVDRARRLMKMTMLGPALGGEGIPEWPLSRDKTSDERFLAVLADALHLDEKAYRMIVTEAWELTLTRKFSRIYSVIEMWLEGSPRMNREALARAMTIAWLDV